MSKPPKSLRISTSHTKRMNMPAEQKDLAFRVIHKVSSTVVKVRDVMKMIEKDGWFHVGTEGDHRQYKHQTKKGRVTISGHPGEDMPKGTLNSVFKQAGLKK